jgi:hypothetical protein
MALRHRHTVCMLADYSSAHCAYVSAVSGDWESRGKEKACPLSLQMLYNLPMNEKWSTTHAHTAEHVHHA